MAAGAACLYASSDFVEHLFSDSDSESGSDADSAGLCDGVSGSSAAFVIEGLTSVCPGTVDGAVVRAPALCCLGSVKPIKKQGRHLLNYFIKHIELTLY